MEKLKNRTRLHLQAKKIPSCSCGGWGLVYPKDGINYFTNTLMVLPLGRRTILTPFWGAGMRWPKML